MTYKNISTADQVFERLENDIIQGIYPKGEILTELKLVKKLGVSRTPIREALLRLEQEHLIEDTGKGSRVLGITVEDLIDIMTIREYVEGVAAYYATLNMTPEGLAELSNLVELQEFYFEKRDAQHLRQIDDQFHDSICLLSRRAVLIDTLLPLHRKTRRYRLLSIENWDRAAQTKREHFEIFQAIQQGDATLAGELSNRHITNAKKHMKDILQY
ncbi:MAG: GntR family transcriptional regulator [Eubacteriales bacterium]|nr:GntR family transcriptional regulator [Eubacteriales bacterium]